MPWIKKGPRVGTQLLVESDLRDRARAVAVVAACSVADVWREAIDLTPQERTNRKGIDELLSLLDALKVDGGDALAWMINQGVNLTDLKGSADLQTDMVRECRAAQPA